MQHNNNTAPINAKRENEDGDDDDEPDLRALLAVITHWRRESQVLPDIPKAVISLMRQYYERTYYEKFVECIFKHKHVVDITANKETNDALYEWKRKHMSQEFIFRLCKDIPNALLMDDMVFHLNFHNHQSATHAQTQTQSQTKPNPNSCDSKMVIFGAVSGQLHSLLHFLLCSPKTKENNNESNAENDGSIDDDIDIDIISNITQRNYKYLFLGSHVAGKKSAYQRFQCNINMYSLEVICLLFSLKLMFPQNIFLLRSFHEVLEEHLMEHYFYTYEECLVYTKHDKTQTHALMLALYHSFRYLPVACVINDKIFCVSSGLYPGLTAKDMKQEVCHIARPLSVDTNHVFWFLYSQPDFGAWCPGWRFAGRGNSQRFGNDVILEFLEQMQWQAMITGRGFGYRSFNLHDCYSDEYNSDTTVPALRRENENSDTNENDVANDDNNTDDSANAKSNVISESEYKHKLITLCSNIKSYQNSEGSNPAVILKMSSDLSICVEMNTPIIYADTS